MRRSRPPDQELRRWIVAITIFLALAMVLMGASLVAAIYLGARSSQVEPADAIVVMGAAQFNGRPSAVLRARLDTTFRVWEEGMADTIIVTGGKMPGDAFTESEASRDYLMELGVPESAILMENEGQNSEDSLVGVAEIAERRSIERVLIVSDGFHLFRSKMIADDLGLEAIGVPADASPIRPWSGTELDYVLREAAAIVAYVLP
ncbi:MAG: YdcF family protein [Chloroflexota bacterium]|nr:YdcF family protein [Chloroflexota bacterium]